MNAYVVLAVGLLCGLTLAYVVDSLIERIRRRGSHEKETRVHFSPKGGCANAIVTELAAAKMSILVQAYSFTCREICDALIAAVKRGVRVTVLLDKSNETESYSALGDLTGHGIDVRIDGVHAIAHNKVMVIDRRTVLTGSFNFTRQAEHENAENLIILRNQPDMAVLYYDNFAANAGHCHAPSALNDTSTTTSRRAA